MAPDAFLEKIEEASKAQKAFDAVAAKVKANPKDAGAVLKLAQEQMKRFTLAAAKKSFAAAKGLDKGGKNATEIMFGEGVLLAEEGKLKEGAAKLKALVAKYPKAKEVAHALFMVGMIHVRAGEREEALKSFGKVADDHKGSPYAPYAALMVKRLEGQ